MPAVAVPEYMGADFSQSSPGMRFGMYLPVWSSGWSKENQPRWESICQLNANDRETANSLLERQNALAEKMSQEELFNLPAVSTAPFSTGLGNEHPLENGFSFLWPYGLPYLPGSGVKGVLRQAARELAAGDWGESPWQSDVRFTLSVDKKAVELDLINLLFGLESKDGQSEHIRGVLTFWDVIPQIKGNTLTVEVMTPHQKHYYQEGQTPHDSGQPVPINFLTVPPGSEFGFHVVCDTDRLKQLAPDLCEEQKWQSLLQAAFQQAFDWLGFGAKTAVGYGAMQLDPAIARQQQLEAEEHARKQEEQRKQKEEADRRAKMQAEFDALPEQEQALIELQKTVGDLPDTLNKNRYPDFESAVSDYLKKAENWSLDQRIEAADLAETLYDKYSWGKPGLKSTQKKKQEKKKREKINKLRDEK